jgi:hypothetical protein
VINPDMLGSRMIDLTMIDSDMSNWDKTYAVKLSNKAFVRLSINWFTFKLFLIISFIVDWADELKHNVKSFHELFIIERWDRAH